MSDIGNEVSFASLNDLALREFPELVPRYRAELEAWKGEIPGQHIVFADVLTPYLVELVENPRSTDRARRAFSFLERLASQDEPKIREVVALSVLDPLRNRSKREKWIGFLGPKMWEILRDLEGS
jgi:hypothetical protein